MRTRTYSVQEWIRKNRLQLPLTPLRPDDWRPPENQAALVFTNRLPNTREFHVTCRDGTFAAPFDTWRDARAEFGVRHPQCVITLTRLEWWPAGAAPVAAGKVTATADDAAQAALGRVRAQGERTARYVAAHGACKWCVPGCAEVSAIATPDDVALSIEHERGCPAREV